jgi:FkbM family methyltransferase
MTRVAPRARVYAIEPSAFSIEVLKTTLAWHGIKGQVTPVRAAVSDAPGELLLVTPRKITGRMGRAYAFVAEAPPEGKLRPDLEDTGRELQPTPVITIDGFCAERGITKVDFIRMDIEGAELKALRGALGVIERDRPNVLIEIHPQMLEARFGGSAAEVVDVFRARGYRMFTLNGHRLEEREAPELDRPWKDYFFIHPIRAGRLPDGVFKARMAA